MAQKILLYTSVLALAACAGGTGGTGSTSYDATVASNANVTGMRTSIEVGADGHNVAVRSAINPSTGNRVYDLSDVKFTMADEGFAPEGISFKVDSDKKITDFAVAEEEGGERVFNRIDNTNTFSGKVNHKGPGDEESREYDAVLTYSSMGKDLGLKYSDFGVFDIDVIEGWRPVFAGGYDDVKKVVPTNEETKTFNGRAVGHVMAIKNGEGSGTGLPLDAAATLKFKNGESTLTANFDNWYDIEYKESTGNKRIEFSNYKNDDTYKLITTESDNKVAITNTNIESDIRYFGDDNTPSEAVGLIQVRDCGGGECTSDYDNTPEVRMNLGFGAK